MTSTRTESKVTMTSARSSTLTVIALAILGMWFIGSHFIVHTRAGVRVYSKSQFGFGDSFVDVRTMPFVDLRHHVPLATAMVSAGDAVLLPGGRSLQAAAILGATVSDAMTKFSSETELGQAIARAMDSTATLTEATFQAAQKANDRYDVSGKALRAATKAADAASTAAGKMAEFLRKRQ